MNTISLVLNGHTAADIALLPEKQRSSLTTMSPRAMHRRAFSDISTITLSSFSPASSPFPLLRRKTGGSVPSSPVLSGRSTPRSSFSLSRPSSSRRSSKGSNSPGWYNQENNLTLDDFAQRLNTTSKRFEIWQGRCAQNVVMALMRPTPLILFVLNPIFLLAWAMLAFWWFKSG